jgi:site-specific DNA-methyltransferase (adenine-specific)
MDWLTMSSLTNLAQLSLLDLSGKSTGQSAEISWIPVTDLHPHPDNPRLIYRQDIIDTIAASIAEGGFKPEYALLVRPFSGGYQVISGHTRLKAAQQAGCSVLPCWVKDLDDEAAFMELVLANNQGELSPLEYGMHVLKYVELSEGGRGKKGGLSEYARVVGKDRRSVRDWGDAAIVAKNLGVNPQVLLEFTTHLAAIHKAPADDWQWLTEMLLEEGWSVVDTEAKVKRIKAVEDLNCPEWLAPILQITKAKRRSLNDDRIARTLEICVEAAVQCYESLQPVVLQFPDGETLRTETWDLQAQYVDALANTQGIANNPTKGSFTKPKDRILRAVEEIKSTAERWKLDRADGEEKARLESEERRRCEQLSKEYQPIGFVGDIRDVLPSLIAEYRNSFDLVLTDPPYLLSNDGITARGNKQVSVNKNFADNAAAIAPEAWFPLCLQMLKPGGIMVFTCTEHLNINVSRIETQGFEFLERLFWIKRSAPPRLTPTGHRACVEEIWICKKPGDTHLFNYDLLKEKYWQEKQPSNYLEFEQCSGNERLGWHDTQKPLKLWSYLIEAYSSDGSSILDPFAGSGTTPVAAKQLMRKCCWIEMDDSFYQKANQRIHNTAFPWEA